MYYAVHLAALRATCDILDAEKGEEKLPCIGCGDPRISCGPMTLECPKCEPEIIHDESGEGGTCVECGGEGNLHEAGCESVKREKPLVARTLKDFARECREHAFPKREPAQPFRERELEARIRKILEHRLRYPLKHVLVEIMAAIKEAK